MARYLVVSHLTATSPELIQHVRSVAQADPSAEFTLLVPISSHSDNGIVWDEVEGIETARRAANEGAAFFRAAGARVTRTTIGSREPVSAIEDELREHPPYDAIIIATLPLGVSRWLKLDPISRAREKTGLSVTHVIATPGEHLLTTAGTAPGAIQPLEAPAPAKPAHAFLTEEVVATLPLPRMDKRGLPPEMHALWDRLDTGRGVANLFGTLGHNAGVMHGYVVMLNELWHHCGLDAELRELVILRVAQLHHSPYVWQEHVAIARDHGISDDRITALEHWRSSERVPFDERERAVLGYVDAEVHGGAQLRDAHELLSRYVPVSTIIGLNLLAGFYRMTASLAEAFHVPTETPFVGWELYAPA